MSTNPPSTSPPEVASVFILVFSMNELFVQALSNPQSPEFRSKSQDIRDKVEPIFRRAFPNFIKMIIHNFWSGSIVTNSTLDFNDNGTIPTNSTVKQTLVNAANTTYLNISTDSISVSEVPVTKTISTTSMSTNSSSPTSVFPTLSTSTNLTSTQRSSTNATSALSTSTNATLTLSPSTSGSSTTSSSTTTSTSTSSPSTTLPPTPPTFNLTFSIIETFDAALANNSSPQFQAKSRNIHNQIEPLFKRFFTSFILMQIVIFRNGSIITESNLYMNPSGPNVTLEQVKSVFLGGLSSFNFTVDPNSVSVTLGNSMPPAIASSLSMILMTLLLSISLHFEL
ncbi:cell wall protein DAN4-like [Silurus meridionalis]|uniref:cell wall protein DAN4-like n=1 Tax=Silurus meridionalis TaxID=175797 RepID=UPI001EEC90CE|nr:cell wall protein DAN4-like [Silurus meridionalis]